MTKLCWVALAMLCMVAATEGFTTVQEIDSFEFGSGVSMQFFIDSFFTPGTTGNYNSLPIGAGTPPIGGATGNRDCQYVADVPSTGGSLFVTLLESSGEYDIALSGASAWIAMDYDGVNDGSDVIPTNQAGPVSPDNDPTLNGLGGTSFFTDFNAVGVTYLLTSDHALVFDIILYQTNIVNPSIGSYNFPEPSPPGPRQDFVAIEYANDFAPAIAFSDIGALRLLLTTAVEVDARLEQFFTFTNEISGHVYEDCNENFTDNGEFDIVGATLQLRECNTVTILQTTTTDINGDYSFGVDSSVTCYDVCLDTSSAPFFGSTVVYEPGVTPNSVFCYEDITVFDSLNNDFGATSTEIFCTNDSLDCTEDEGTAPSNTGDTISPTVSTLGLCNPSFQFSDNTVPNSCLQTITRFFTTTDANSATCSQTIVVSDTTGPTLDTSPPNQLIDCNDDTSEAANGFPTYNDDCNTPTRVLQPDVVNPGCGNTVVITRTWTVADTCDNAGPTVQQTITTQDTTNPTVTAPLDFSGPCDGTPTGTATGTDDCGTVIFTPGSSFTDINVVTDPCGTTFTRRWTGADECGNVGTADQLISLTDQDPPTITPPAATTIDCNESSAESNTGSPTNVADACGGPVSVSSSDGAVTGGPCTQTFVRTWTASDQCGTTSDTTVSQTITIDDSIAPSLSVPNTAVVQCNLASTAPSSTGFATAVDDCQGNLTPTFTDTSVGNSCFTTISRTWTVDDGCGQVSTGTQTVNVQDTTPPTFTVPADNNSLQCSDPTDTGANGTPTGVSDACSGLNAPVFVDTTTGSGCVTTITRRWTVSDVCGQTSPTQTQTLVFTDTQAPSVTAPADATVQCGGATDPSVTGTASTVDDCNTNPSLNFGDSVISGDGCIDTFTRTWTSSDGCNTGSSVQTITIQDTTPPTISVNSETVELCPCLAATGFTDAGPTACGSAAVGSDACQGAVTTTFSDNTVLSTCGQVLREWTASDGCGNVGGPVTQTLTFVDSSGPVFQVASVVSPLALQCGDDTSVLNTGIAAFTDCTSVTVSFQDATTINDGCNFSVDRTFTATNDCGTTSSFTQTITADDTLAPTFDTFPGTVTLECGTSTGAFAIGSAPTVSDICQGSLTLTYTDSVSTVDVCTDQINRSWITDDGCGNFNTQVQVIFVEDTTVPIFNAFPADVSTECIGGGPGAYPPATFGSATGTDACSPLGTFAASFTDPPVISGSCPGTFSRTWQVTDTCGLSVSSVQSFTINDTTPPVFSSFPADATVECDTSSAPSVTGTPGVTEACTFSPATFTDGVLVGSCPITFQRTWTATDTCQSINSVQVITIDDTSAPFFSFFPNDLPSLECGDSTSPSVTGSPTADDSCSFSSASTPTFSDSVVTTGANCIVTITRTWSTTNTCGTTFTADQTLTYTDTQPPAVISVPGNSIQECTTPIPAPNGVPGTDACSGALGSVTTSESTSGICPQIFTRQYLFADTCGNVDVRTQVITITDTTPPTITDVNDVTVDCNDPRGPGNTGFPTAGDSCDPSTPSITFQDVETTAQCPNDVVTRTFTATDWCGNQATSQQDITVTNNLPPVVTAPNDVVVECGESTDSVDLGTATAVHPCNLGFVITFTDALTPGGDSCLEFTTRTWSATDICGNVGTDDQLIEVSDNVEPDFTCFPDDVTVHCSDSTDPSNTGGFPCATDECQGVVCQITFFDSAPVQLPAIGDCPADLVYTRTWLADDACGLQVSQNQIITVIFHEQAEDCPAEPCPAVPCQLCECPVEPPCNCCAMGGITACNPVPCNPVECTAVPCTAVDCLPCPVSSGTTASPSQPCGPEVPCIPQIRFVHVNDDDDNRAVTDGNYVQEQPAQRDGEDDGDDDNDDDNGTSQLAGAMMAMLLPIVVFLLFN